MYICGLIPRILVELVEAVPIGYAPFVKVQTSVRGLKNMIRNLTCPPLNYIMDNPILIVPIFTGKLIL